MEDKKVTVALIYDFDGTLSPQYLQEPGFIRALDMNPSQFWNRTRNLSEEHDASEILCYMKLMLEEARHAGISVKRKSFADFGKQVELFEGVEEWFDLINKYGNKIGLEIKHYINSSGLKEMIEGTSIADKFTEIYACSFLYDPDGVAVWPAVAVDYTTKTQFIFKINKGIREVSDNVKVNRYVPEDQRAIPYKRMIYFGDGTTDIPCMKMLKERGGYSVAVYNPSDAEKRLGTELLIEQDRTHFVCAADYRKGKNLYDVVTTILQKMKRDYDFECLQKKHQKDAEDYIKKHGTQKDNASSK